MNHFRYSDNVLCAESVPLDRLAEAVGTPFYCYSTATLERHYRVFSGALPPGSLVAFSVKANGNLAVLKTLARLGAGADEKRTVQTEIVGKSTRSCLATARYTELIQRE